MSTLDGMTSQAEIQRVFATTPKPRTFVNPNHCCECAEHNETLSTHTADTISLAELGNPGWDPICFIESIEGFKYYIPAMTRLACGVGDNYYLDQFLFHLNNERVGLLSTQERCVLAGFLESLIELMPDEIERNLDTDVVLERILCLRGSGAA